MTVRHTAHFRSWSMGCGSPEPGVSVRALADAGGGPELIPLLGSLITGATPRPYAMAPREFASAALTSWLK